MSGNAKLRFVIAFVASFALIASASATCCAQEPEIATLEAEFTTSTLIDGTSGPALDEYERGDPQCDAGSDLARAASLAALDEEEAVELAESLDAAAEQGPGASEGSFAPPVMQPVSAVGVEFTDSPWTWQILPDGILYRTYLAGEKEPRFAATWLHQQGRGWIWETALGGRVGLVRYGTPGAVGAEGWQLDLEGGALTRLDWENHTDVDATDYRIGFPLTYRRGNWGVRVGYTHLSSHIGDEFILTHPGAVHRNYVRDSVFVGLAYYYEDMRLYAEVAVAPGAQGGAEPLEVQAGAEYSPLCFGWAPFAAVNMHYREEFSTSASVNIEAGCQYRSYISNRLFRVGVQHYNGNSLQYSFFDQYEQLTGFGMWFDF